MQVPKTASYPQQRASDDRLKTVTFQETKNPGEDVSKPSSLFMLAEQRPGWALSPLQLPLNVAWFAKETNDWVLQISRLGSRT